jgi:hypothetical protein
MFTTDVFEERSGSILRVEELLFSSEDGDIKVGKQLRGYITLHDVVAEMTGFFEN